MHAMQLSNNCTKGSPEKRQYMKESNSSAINVIMKQLRRKVLLNTKGQCMKESNSLADNSPAINVTNKHLRWEVLLNTKRQYMKWSNILVGSAGYNYLGKDILQHTKGLCMKESNTLVGNVTIKQLQRTHEGVKYPCRQCNYQATTMGNLVRQNKH